MGLELQWFKNWSRVYFNDLVVVHNYKSEVEKDFFLGLILNVMPKNCTIGTFVVKLCVHFCVCVSVCPKV